MKIVIAVLVSYPKKNKNKAGYPQRKTEDYEGSIFFLHSYLAEKIAHMFVQQSVLKHSDQLLVSKIYGNKAKYMPLSH
jgi:hypothetical protein